MFAVGRHIVSFHTLHWQSDWQSLYVRRQTHWWSFIIKTLLGPVPSPYVHVSLESKSTIACTPEMLGPCLFWVLVLSWEKLFHASPSAWSTLQNGFRWSEFISSDAFGSWLKDRVGQRWTLFQCLPIHSLWNPKTLFILCNIFVFFVWMKLNVFVGCCFFRLGHVPLGKEIWNLIETFTWLNKGLKKRRKKERGPCLCLKESRS